METETIVQPSVTLPPCVHDLVTQEYGAANVILEYGSGGSTVIAAMSGAQTFSVENDPVWAGSIERWLEENDLKEKVTLHHADIGPTKLWGRPEKWRLRHAARYLQYPLSVWKLPEFRHPDIILVDGRFRVACFLCAIAQIRRPTRLLFDDYAERDHYHAVESFQRPSRLVERMAVFDLEPRAFSTVDWLRTMPMRLNPE